MRRLDSEKEREEKRKRTITIISLILLGIMVISSAGFAFMSSNESPEESQIDPNGRWVKEVNGKKMSFQYAPEEVQNISVSPFVKKAQTYVNQPIYVSIKNDLISREIASTLGLFASRMQRVCYGECTENLPEKNCSEESNEKVIIWIDSEKQDVSETNGCVFIEGDMRSVDAFLYKIFDVL